MVVLVLLLVGGAIPREYIGSCDKGFRSCLERGSLIGFPIIGVRATINDGAYHDVDSSDMAFQIGARYGFRQGFSKAAPIIRKNPNPNNIIPNPILIMVFGSLF